MKNVLIADANNAFRQGLAFLLEEQASLGTVAQAVSLAEARRALPDVNHNVDLAVVSLDLPERRARALRAGADEVLGMSSSPEELVRVASRLVQT